MSTAEASTNFGTRRVRADREEPRGEQTDGPVDPRPDPVAVSSDRIAQLVATIDEKTREDWGTTRDGMDDMMRAFQEEGEAINRAVGEYAEKYVALIGGAVPRGAMKVPPPKPAPVTALPQRQ